MHKFTSKSVIVDGTEYFYYKIKDIVFRNTNPAAYIFDYEGQKITLEFEPHQDAIEFKIFEKLKSVTLNAGSKDEPQTDESVTMQEILTSSQEPQTGSVVKSGKTQMDRIEELIKDAADSLRVIKIIILLVIVVSIIMGIISAAMVNTAVSSITGTEGSSSSYSTDYDSSYDDEY